MSQPQATYESQRRATKYEKCEALTISVGPQKKRNYKRQTILDLSCVPSKYNGVKTQAQTYHFMGIPNDASSNYASKK